MTRRFLRRLANHLPRRFSRSTPKVTAAARQIIDDTWYFNRYPQAQRAGVPALDHYLQFGARLGYDPSPYLWTRWYLERYPDVAAEQLNPLLHYLQHGAWEGRNPSPLFDGAWYAGHYLAGDAAGVNPLLHYITIGKERGHAATPDGAAEAFRRGDKGARLQPIDRIRRTVSALRAGEREAYYNAPLRSCAAWLAERGTAATELSASGLGAEVAREAAASGLFERSPYHAWIEDVTVLPGSATIVAPDGVVLNDEVTFVHDRFGYTETKLPDRMWVHDGDVLLKYGVKLTPAFKTGIHLFKEHEQNYFHFMFEVAMRLHLIEKDGLVPPEVPILMADDLDKRLYDMIELVKHPERKIIGLQRNVPYRIGRLFYLSDTARIVDAYDAAPDDRHTFIADALVRSFAAHIKAALGEDANRPARRLYLTRNSERRGMVNQREVVHELLGRGFETPSLDLFSLESQVRIMSQAAVVVGATGAAFANLVWCQPGTRVLILYPEHPFSNRTFWNAIGRAVGLDIAYLDGERKGRHVGKYGMHDDFSIALDQFGEAVSTLLGRDG